MDPFHDGSDKDSGPAPVASARRTVQSPLTLVMTIRSPEAFQALNTLIQKIQSAPPEQNPIWAALDKLRIVHFARFVFLENNTRLAIITTYDGSFEDYLNEFIDEIGDIFNTLLQYMDGAPPLPIQQNRGAFRDYVKANDLGAIGPFYSAYPQATVLDIQAALGEV
ncbi:hypothetical protein SAMN05216420_101287 [Nitrosospira sp. Nl5]|uniref:hypothetical protein n=1 Tax=Nitrosospira sp. Nl5 TaxID=200120 RepID=UPI000888C56D|nr:hypothetical protein [Nitrosospira sp. Nl5]SCX90516.1 hypothetical protein SAMN05216420_101287 [Nitrosospira sp. Nl5]